MQNLKIKIVPLHLRYSSEKPLSVILKYKRVMITTNHDLEKYECKQKFLVINGEASLEHEDAPIEIELSKELELMNTKVRVAERRLI